MLEIIFDFGTLTLGGFSLPLRVYGYGLMLVLGFLCSLGIGHMFARRIGENPENFTRCGILALVGGVIGARIAYIIQHFDSLSRADNPI
ncbi:unnamed protein product, partial [marine sediment metagenome]